MKNTKRALMLSCLSMLLCVTMLVGSTFAWFTDTATTAVNSIKSGVIDIRLVDPVTGESLEGKGVSFVDKNGNKDILWEPGATFYSEPVRVMNHSNLSFYLDVFISGFEGDLKLLEAIDFKIVYYDRILEGETWKELGGRGDLVAGTGTVFTGEGKNGNNWMADVYGIQVDWTDKDWAVSDYNLDGVIDEKDVIPGAGEAKPLMDICIVGHMKEEAGNEYQGLTLSGAGLTFSATQAPYENDSYNDQYDQDAEFPDLTPDNQAEFNELIYNNPNATIKLDSVYSGILEIPANADGMTVDASATTGLTKIQIAEGAKNITFVGLSYININREAQPAGSMGTITIKDSHISGTDCIIKGNALTDLVVEDCTFSNGAQYPVYDNYTGFKNVTVRNCTFTDISTGPVLIMGPNDKNVTESITVDNCTFTNCTKDYLVKCGTMKDGGTITFTNNTLVNCPNLGGNPFEIVLESGENIINYVIGGNTLDGVEYTPHN